MNSNRTLNNGNGATTYQPLTLMVAAWDQNRVTPGSRHYLGVTLTNRGAQEAVVQVRLESASAVLRQWCPQPEQWLALGQEKSAELTFCIEVPAEALPQWLDYEVVVRPKGAYADAYLPPYRCRLQILAPEATEAEQDPTFRLSPVTSPDRPLVVQPGVPVTVELVVENRSDRVDRFRIECTGLPEDWGVQAEYPRDYGGLGLVQQDDSVGVNPGDRGTIRVLLQPPPLPLAGSYLPTFRLTSDNAPNLGLLGLVYLQVEPVYQLQSQLQIVQDQVRDRPAQFTVQLLNLGNTPRLVQLRLQALTPPGDCVYRVPEEVVAVPPQTSLPIALEGQPQRWWTRPWFGAGRIYPFRIDLSDPDRRPVAPDTLQGYLTWAARPWWQLLLVVLAGLGLIGTLAFLIWWYWLRSPAPPQVLEFAAEDSRYSENNGDMARVRWQIEAPGQIQNLKLTGYSPDGTVVSGPLTYDFQQGKLPAALQPFCTQQANLLSCNQVRSDAFQPGKYIFELTLTPRGRQAKPQSFKTNPVEIVAKPLPTVMALIPQALVYREAAPGMPTAAEKAIPVIDRNGVRLDWVVTMPGDLRALYLAGRDQEGKLVGDLWFEFPSPGQLPPALQPFCRLGQTLVCRQVPTGLTAVGEYRLELKAIGQGQPESPEVKPKTTEAIQILPQAARILNFQINGREAPAKLLIPVIPGRPGPVLQVGWRVQGSATTQVELNPAPGSVPLTGRVLLPISAQGGGTLTLQVKTASGQTLTRSVALEVYDPSQPNPVGAGAGAATGAQPPGSPGAASGATPAGAAAPSAPTAPAPAVNDRLAPLEQPPQFNGGG